MNFPRTETARGPAAVTRELWRGNSSLDRGSSVPFGKNAHWRALGLDTHNARTRFELSSFALGQNLYGKNGFVEVSKNLVGCI